MKRYAWMLCTVALILVTTTAEAAKKKAYILVGDMKQSGYSQFWQSIYYTYGISGNRDIHDQMKDLIAAKRKEFEAKGYDVVLVDNAVSHDLKKALNDRDTDAFVFFGHGVQGTLSMADGETVAPGDISSWRNEQYARDNGLPVQRNGSPDWAKIKTYSAEERKKCMDIWRNRPGHYDISEAYFHTCFSLENNKLADVLMSDCGDFTGFKGKGYLTQAMDKPDNIRGTQVTQGDINSLGMLKKSRETYNIPNGEANVVVSRNKEGNSRWDVSWTDAQSGDKVTLVIWSDKDGRITETDFGKTDDMQSELELNSITGKYNVTKSGATILDAKGVMHVKLQSPADAGSMAGNTGSGTGTGTGIGTGTDSAADTDDSTGAGMAGNGTGTGAGTGTGTDTGMGTDSAAGTDDSTGAGSEAGTGMIVETDSGVIIGNASQAGGDKNEPGVALDTNSQSTTDGTKTGRNSKAPDRTHTYKGDDPYRKDNPYRMDNPYRNK